MSRTPHVSESKWGDDPDDFERFEEAQWRDLATVSVVVALLVVLVVTALLVLGWYAFVSTIHPGPTAILLLIEAGTAAPFVMVRTGIS